MSPAKRQSLLWFFVVGASAPLPAETVTSPRAPAEYAAVSAGGIAADAALAQRQARPGARSIESANLPGHEASAAAAPVPGAAAQFTYQRLFAVTRFTVDDRLGISDAQWSQIQSLFDRLPEAQTQAISRIVILPTGAPPAAGEGSAGTLVVRAAADPQRFDPGSLLFELSRAIGSHVYADGLSRDERDDWPGTAESFGAQYAEYVSNSLTDWPLSFLPLSRPIQNLNPFAPAPKRADQIAQFEQELYLAALFTQPGTRVTWVYSNTLKPYSGFPAYLWLTRLDYKNTGRLADRVTLGGVQLLLKDGRITGCVIDPPSANAGSYSLAADIPGALPIAATVLSRIRPF